MREYSGLKKKNTGRGLLIITLGLCVMLSGILLFSRLLIYSSQEQKQEISLSESRGDTKIMYGEKTEDGELEFRKPEVLTSNPILLGAKSLIPASWFRVEDEKGIWKGETDIEIFHMSYQNDFAEITVNSGNTESIVAPGTSNRYQFALGNTSGYPVKYEMNMEAYFTDGSYVIPIEVRVYDHDERYLAGSATEYVDVLALNHVSDSGTLGNGNELPYTLEWQWPFEADDEYDTMLGNLSVGEEIGLTIVIHTLASYEPTADGGIPKTGDESPVGILIGMLLLAFAGLMVLLYRRKGVMHEEA